MPLCAIQGELPEALATRVGCEAGDVRRFCAAIHQRDKDPFREPSSRVSRQTRQRLALDYRIGQLEIAERAASPCDGFVKYLMASEDGARVECVRIPLEKAGRFTVCVSSQVGCALDCRFCATGRLGLTRNLETWEIVEQVRRVRLDLPEKTRIHGVVFQGMGEPLANVERVITAIEVLSHPALQAIDQRNITVCTSGIASGIRRLTESQLRIRLGWSLGSARPELRRQLMPIEGAQPLRSVLDAVVDHVRQTANAPMLAVTLLSGVNTSPEDAAALRELALELAARSGLMPRVSLVPYNPIGGEDPFRRATADEAERFRESLRSAGFPVVRRYSGGADIAAACGQLAAQHTG